MLCVYFASMHLVLELVIAIKQSSIEILGVSVHSLKTDQ
jgi:hypothetical protein